jgi:hypothetical protein
MGRNGGARMTDERVVGRFSTGQEEEPGRASILRVGCFADGTCDPARSLHQGRFSGGLETGEPDRRLGSFGDVDGPEPQPVGAWEEGREADLGPTMA